MLNIPLPNKDGLTGTRTQLPFRTYLHLAYCLWRKCQGKSPATVKEQIREEQI
jgi:hypothetical protein